MMYFTYIIYSEKINRYYTGQTKHPEHRLAEHNRGKTSFLARGIPWKMVFSKQFATRSEAVNLEKMIKKRGAERFLIDNQSHDG